MKLEAVVAVLSLALPLGAQYAGPAILTRGEAPAAMVGPDVRFRPFASISGLWDSGLAAVRVTDTGDLARDSSFGMAVDWGVSGSHSWRYTKLGLSYRGGISHYFRNTSFDNLDQSMLLGVTRRLSRRLTLSLSETAGMVTRDYGLIGLQQTVPFDPTTTYIPRTDYFDNRTIYLSSRASLVYQRTARLSFNMGGIGFLTRRRSTALYGTIGAAAQGDAQYRLTRNVTIGAAYGYEHFEFTRVFGATDAHSIAGAFAVRLSRFTEFSGYAGASRAETKFIQNVPLSPAIIALLGITESREVVHNILWEPNLSGRLSRRFRDGVAYLSAGHSIVPGNGLFLTSTSTMVMAGYSYTGLRRWSFGASAAYNRSRSIGNIVGRYSGVSGDVNAARRLIRSLHFTASFGARKYFSQDFDRYNRVIYSARVGLGFSPGDIPLRIW